MAFTSEKQRHAAFRRMAGGGGDALAGRQTGEMFGRRGNGGRLVWSAQGTRDRLLLGRAAARVPEGVEALKRFETTQRRDQVRSASARRALVRGLGMGAGVAALGGGIALGVSPRLQIALGRRLMQTHRVLPTSLVRGPLEAAGETYLKARRWGAAQLADKAANTVKWLERKVAGYTPGANGPQITGPPLRRRVRLEAIHPNDVAQRWMAQQADQGLPANSLAFSDSALGHQYGWVDQLDALIKRRLQRGFGRKHRFHMDIDPEWTRRFGTTPTRRTFSETINHRQQGYAQIRLG